MSMLDSFFNKGFKAAKCKTLLKLTIPRIKLLRNRREIQIKQMRRDIAKLLETGQEATARIRVEHIIREENMMAAQEIIELFCELISVRLPIIEAQRECPLDLKEAISSVCFAAPRCADLPELLQVQMLFGMKYGKEFLSAATELMPECGVNRQLIELLSIRAPSPEKRLDLLKEIAEEHGLDWDPADTETELLKPHEDLLNGLTQFVSGSKLPLPKEKHDETLISTPDLVQNEQPVSDEDFDQLDLPEVPKVPLRVSADAASAPEPSSSGPNVVHELLKSAASERQESYLESKDINTSRDDLVATPDELHNVDSGTKDEKQFLPFLAPPAVSSTSFTTRPASPPSISRTKSEVDVDLQDVLPAAEVAAAGKTSMPLAAKQACPPPSISKTNSEVNVDLQDVLAAAQAAAESAEHAAAAARSAASLAQARISELTKKNSENFPESISDNPFHTDIHYQSPIDGKPQSSDQHSLGDSPDMPSYDKLEAEFDSHSDDQGSAHHQPQRLHSLEDESYFSYPNLFTNANLGSSSQSSVDNNHSTHLF